MIPSGDDARQVASAVSAWSWLTAFAARVRRSENAVMSNWSRSPSTPSPSSSTASTGTPPVCGRPSPSSSGPATCRTRSAANRSLPAGTGVWIVKTLSRRTRSQASSSVVAGRHVLAGPLREQERRVALVQVPDRRLDPERPERPDAADAEDELLVEPHLAAADVEDVGDRPVGVAVLGDVGVEQEDRRPADLGHQTAIWRSRPGSSTVTWSGSPSRPGRG